MKSYHAVSIIPGTPCCEGAGARRGRKELSSEAPRLPLPDCTMPDRCRCRFQKHTDRRTGDDDRRMYDTSQRSIWYGGQEKRRARGRREGDA